MTVVNHPARNQYVATNLQTIFNYTFEIAVNTDIKVYQRAGSAAPDDTADLLTLTTDYTVTGVGSSGGGTIVLVTGATTGDIISIQGNAPADRDTSFTPGGVIAAQNLNTEFDNLVLIYQTILAVLDNLVPTYPESAIVSAKDTILAVLGAGQGWRMNDANDEIEPIDLPSGGIAGNQYSYITVHDNTAGLPNSFPLSAFATGLVVSVQDTLVTTRSIAGTTNQITVANANGLAGNPTLAIANNPVIPGTEGMGLPIGTTLQRPGVPSGTNLRRNTDLNQLEYWDGSAWIQLEDSGDFADLANLKFILKEASVVTPNAQSLGALTTGIVKNTVAAAVGTLSISAPLTSIDGLTTVANNLIYTTAADTYAVITPANGGVMITSAAGVPSWLANPAAAGRMLQSGNAAAATWSTATYPSVATGAGTILRANGTNWLASTSTFADTYALNTILYASAANVVSGLATATNGVLITDGTTGIPSISSTLPQAVQDNITRLGTQAEALNMGGFDIGNIPSTPSTDNSAASKFYVDQTALSGTAVYAATTATLNATQAGAGVGATLTDASGTFAAFSVDGVSPPLNSDILNKNQAAAANQGIYTLTQNGDGISIPWVLTRSVTYDTPSQINQTGLITVRHGTANAGTAWYNASTIVTVDTTAFSYSSFGLSLPVVVASGGTGATSFTAYAPIFGGTTSTNPLQSGAVGTAGQVLTSNGAGAIATFQDASSSRPNPNTIIGGNFDTNPWQRGTTFTSVTDGTNTADRMLWVQTGTTGVVDIKKTADAPTVAEAGIFVQNCLHIDVTTADVAVAAGDFASQRYKIEGYDWAQLAQREFTLSFWVKSTKTGIFCVAFGNSGFDRTYVAEYTINTTDTWEKKTITVSASPAAGTWNYTNGIGLVIDFTQICGSTYQTTAGTWNSVTAFATANQVNGLDSTANNFKLDLIKVEPGSSATAWEMRSEAEELSLCQRYYEKSYNQGVNPATATTVGIFILGSLTTGTTAMGGVSVPFAVVKRAAPTVTIYDGAGNAGKCNRGGDNKTASGGDLGMSCFDFSSSDTTSANNLYIQWTASAEM